MIEKPRDPRDPILSDVAISNLPSDTIQSVVVFPSGDVGVQAEHPDGTVTHHSGGDVRGLQNLVLQAQKLHTLEEPSATFGTVEESSRESVDLDAIQIATEIARKIASQNAADGETGSTDQEN